MRPTSVFEELWHEQFLLCLYKHLRIGNSNRLRRIPSRDKHRCYSQVRRGFLLDPAKVLHRKHGARSFTLRGVDGAALNSPNHYSEYLISTLRATTCAKRTTTALLGHVSLDILARKPFGVLVQVSEGRLKYVGMAELLPASPTWNLHPRRTPVRKSNTSFLHAAPAVT